MHSDCPLVAGWKGAEQICWIPYLIVKSKKSPELKLVPLSVTIKSCRLWVVNSFHKAHMVTWDDMVDIETTSRHLKWESTMMRNVWP